MGMSPGGSGARGVRGEINITPLVDVVLVLLIIFLVTMPMVQKAEPVEVPPKAGPDVISERTITVKVKNDLTVIVNDGDKDVSVQAIDLARTLRPIVDARRTQKVVFVDFEAQVPWDQTMSIIDTVRSFDPGAMRVALATHDELAAATAE